MEDSKFGPVLRNLVFFHSLTLLLGPLAASPLSPLTPGSSRVSLPIGALTLMCLVLSALLIPHHLPSQRTILFFSDADSKRAKFLPLSRTERA